MDQDILEKFEKCKEDKNCPNNQQECIIKKENNVATPLIFENTFKSFADKNKGKYKIVLVTESPYNFPGCPIHKSKCENDKCEYWVNDVDEFIRRHLAKFGFGRFGAYFPDKEETQNHIPWNIFSFIFYIFYPIFKHISQRFYGCSENDIRILWAYSFVNKVYWTHVAKRSLKGLDKKNKKKVIKQCIPVLKEELEAIKPNLIIVATHWIFGYEEIEACQQCYFSQNNDLIKLKDVKDGLKKLIKNKWKNKNNELEKMIDNIPLELKIAVFPNPSPKNYKNKVDFYKKEYVPELIKKIHEEIERNYDKLPDC
ncbi:MAG: hypothetical protein ABIK77_07680 [candidate division WOR-3 bacterium]